MLKLREIVLELMSGKSVLGFYQASKSFYFPSIPNPTEYIDDIMIGIYHYRGGTDGELAIEWTFLSGKPVACLKIYDDGWHLLTLVPDLIEFLGNNVSSLSDKSITSDEMARKLTLMGYRDLTRYTCEQSSGFVQSIRTAPIPQAWANILNLSPEWSHYTGIAEGRILEDWAKPSRYMEMPGVLLTTNTEDAALIHLHLA